jgi:hypothetical protein
MRIRFVAVMVLAIASSLRGQTRDGPTRWLEDFEKRFPPAGKNAAAEEVERLALALGVDWRSDSSSPEDHPAKEDLEAYAQAQFGSWLDAQIRTSDDSIASPPARLKEYFERRDAIVARLTGSLVRDVPDWGFDIHKKPISSDLTLVARLSRIVLSAALSEERSERHVEAARLLEASWSLYQSVVSRPELISQLIGIAIAKLHIGVLRKMAEPPFEWLDRMAGDTPWQKAVEGGFENDPLIVHAADRGPPPDSFFDVWVRGLRAAAENVRDLSACRASKLTVDEMWEPVFEQLARWKEEGTDTVQAAGVFKEISAENLLQALRRAARLRVDRELTSKILELRQEKAASRDHRWPERFLDTGSRVCPEALYEYQLRGSAMAIRFKGSIEDAAAPGLSLPLSFEATAPKPTSTPTRAPRLTATPTRRP